MEENVNRIAERILYIRIKNNLKAAEFARQLGLSQPCVMKWERGISIPKGEQLIKLFQTFGAHPDFILLGLEPCGKDKKKIL